MINRRQFQALAACAIPWAAGSARGQESMTLKMVVGFAPGGTVDAMARAVAEGMRSSGINAIVENRPGAGGRMGTDALLSAPADGTTLMMVPSTNLTLYPHVQTNLHYKISDFSYVGLPGEVLFGLAVPVNGPRTLKEFLERAQKNPKDGGFGTPGNGSVMHLLGELLGKQAKAPLTSVPYKGGASALNDVIGGSVPAIIAALPNLMPMHRSGKLRILAVSSDKPVASLPEVPTFAASGYPALTASEYLCVVARKEIPPAMLERLSGAVTAAIKTAALQSTLDRLGFQAVAPSSPDAIARRVAADYGRMQSIVKELGFKAAD